jgi:hypothetical protein
MRWRGRKCDQPQLANANEGFRDLSPASAAPAMQTRSNWAALLPNSDPVPLIWEDSRRGYREEDC